MGPSSSVAAGAAIRRLLERNIRPSDILTRKAFENAMVTVMALGGTTVAPIAQPACHPPDADPERSTSAREGRSAGSTNAVLHLIAMGKAANVAVTLDDFQTISDRVPYIADLLPR